MRLIDADAINPMRCPRSISEMRKWIDDQPTAYDIDKVIEQLENASCYIEDGNGHAGHLVFTDDAIEIVKGGAK